MSDYLDLKIFCQFQVLITYKPYVQRAMLGVTIRDINSKLAEVKNISVQDGVYVEEVTYYAMNLVE